MNDASAITYEGTYKSYIAVMMKVRINLVKESVARETLGKILLGQCRRFRQRAVSKWKKELSSSSFKMDIVTDAAHR